MSSCQIMRYEPNLFLQCMLFFSKLINARQIEGGTLPLPVDDEVLLLLGVVMAFSTFFS